MFAEITRTVLRIRGLASMFTKGQLIDLRTRRAIPHVAKAKKPSISEVLNHFQHAIFHS